VLRNVQSKPQFHTLLMSALFSREDAATDILYSADTNGERWPVPARIAAGVVGVSPRSLRFADRYVLSPVFLVCFARIVVLNVHEMDFKAPLHVTYFHAYLPIIWNSC
jgi:hypothetical protein